METNPVLNSLLDVIFQGAYTQNQAIRRLSLLKDHLTKRLFSQTREKSPALLALDFEQRWLQSLEEKFLGQFTQENIYKIFPQAEAEVKNITPLTVLLPFELPDKETAQLGDRLRQDYGKHFLMEVKFDATLIAGPALIWKGVYKDYSLRQKIEEKKLDILQMFKGMMRKQG